jgi:hypothetical protein
LRYDFTTAGAFDTVDTLREGGLNHRNIQSFLKINGFYATESELVAIVRRLDIDADSRITFEEFIESTRPAVVAGGDEPLTSSLSRSSPSRFHQEEEKSLRSPLRNSQLEESRLRASGGFGESQSQLTSSVFRASGSPSRVQVSRDLY